MSIKQDMSKRCGFKYNEYWSAANTSQTMPQEDWLTWYKEHCGKCQYMGEICMYGED
jgi:hypothetical protein